MQKILMKTTTIKKFQERKKMQKKIQKKYKNTNRSKKSIRKTQKCQKVSKKIQKSDKISKKNYCFTKNLKFWKIFLLLSPMISS